MAVLVMRWACRLCLVALHPLRPDKTEPVVDKNTGAKSYVIQVNGQKFDGIDVFLFAPHFDFDGGDSAVDALAEKVSSRDLVVGSIVAPIWEPTNGGSCIGDDASRKQYLGQIKKACEYASKLREKGVRPTGIVRVDTGCPVTEWVKDIEGNQKKIIETFKEAADIAESYGEKLGAEGEICWGGMHSWKRMLELLEGVGRPETFGFQADMAHTLLYAIGYNAPEDALLPQGYDWQDKSVLDEALKQLTSKLRPWLIDFHVAQNDATVFGEGSHDKTGRHCVPNDPNGKLDIAHHAGFWLRGEKGELTKSCQHICWDGCMFPNNVIENQQTHNDILAAMLSVREAHGW